MAVYKLYQRGGRTFAQRLRADGTATAQTSLEVCPNCFDAERGGGIMLGGEQVNHCAAGCGYAQAVEGADEETG